MKSSFFILLILSAVAAGQESLKNADFTAVRPDGKPTPLHWYLDGNCTITASKSDGAQVTVTAAGKKDGRLTQSLDVSPQSTYIVSAEIKATVAGMAYVQIEFLDGGNEIKSMPRIDSEKNGDAWTPVTLEFSTKEAKRFSVLCRFEQTARTSGQSASFRNIRVQKKQ